MKEGKVIFITGGARSGKSRFGLRLADNIYISEDTPKKAYIATAEALDKEMKERIERHKKERSKDWTVFEEPLNLTSLLKEIDKIYDVILIDCLTLWLSNPLMHNKDIKAEIESLVALLPDIQCSLCIISNEVGLGIVPENNLARKFRDLSGYMNERIAEIAHEAYLVISGIPLRLK